MNLSDHTNDDKYRRVIEALQPRHAPSTSMKFEPPRKARTTLSYLLNHIGRIAAVLAVGIGIGLMFIRPDTTIAAGKILDLGFEKIKSAGRCDINLNVRLKPSTPDRPFKLSPQGNLVNVVMKYNSMSADSTLSINWADSGAKHFLLVDSAGSVDFDGTTGPSALPSEAMTGIDNIFTAGAEEFRNIINGSGSSVAMKKEGDKITIDISEKGGRFIVEFSDKSGFMTSFKGYDTSGSEPVLMIESLSISYQ